MPAKDEFTYIAEEKKYECNHCKKKYSGDKNLAKHVYKRCHAYKLRKENEAFMQQASQKEINAINILSALLSQGASSSCPCSAGPESSDLQQYQQQEITREEELLASMIALDGCDPSFLDNKDFITRLWPNSSSEIPSRIRIEEVCDIIFDKARRGTAELLRKQVQSQPPGRVSLAVGEVKALDRDVLYMACHFIDEDWKLHRVILNAYVLVPHLPHQRQLSDVREVYAGLGTEYVILEAPQFGASLPAGVDLRSQLFMMAWGILPASYESDHYRHRQDMEARERHSSAMKHQLADIFSGTFPVEMGLFSTSFIDQVLEPIARCLRWLFFGFRKSMTQELMALHLTRQARQQLLQSRLNLKSIPTYDKDWYRTYCALEILQLENPALIDEDPELAKLLIGVFGVIYRAIEAISDPSCPTSNLCLQELFKVRKVLRLELERCDGGNADNIYNISAYKIPKPENITKCLRDAKGTLDKAIEDSYLLWSVPLVLDPRYKLDQQVRSLFESEYGPDKADDMLSKVLSKLNELYANYGGPLDQPMTEIDTYLKDNPVSFKGKNIADDNVPGEECCEVLNWWKENDGKYPTVARMARDALAMPTSSMVSCQQMAYIKSIIRGYSKESYQPQHFHEEAEEKVQGPATKEEAEEQEEAKVPWRRNFFGEENEDDVEDSNEENDGEEDDDEDDVEGYYEEEDDVEENDGEEDEGDEEYHDEEEDEHKHEKKRKKMACEEDYDDEEHDDKHKKKGKMA